MNALNHPAPKQYGPRSLTGHEIRGDRIVRMVYLDESGTGNPAREPFVVIAAVIVNADKHWKAIGQHIADMAQDAVPSERRRDFKAFHATELFSGGKVFERKKDDFEYWWPVLDELVSLPSKFDIPIAFSFFPRKWAEERQEYQERASDAGMTPVVSAQADAFVTACSSIEEWMNNAADTDEVAQLIMENNQATRKNIEYILRLISDPLGRKSYHPDIKPYSVSRIIYPMHFETKSSTSILQLADACAWAIRRRLSRERHSERFFTPLREHLISHKKHLRVLFDREKAVEFN
ncbi:MAG: DUF3800 domain-containing protein [Rhodomicrobium sp.]